MSKKFRIAKRISMENINFEDVVVEYDFIDKDMAQIISDNEYDPMYDDCESIAVALQLAGYSKVADLEAKLAEKDKEIESLKENWNVLCDYLGECIVKYDEIDTNGIYSEVIEKVNKLKKYDTSIAKTQNQIAIEQLEKLLEKTQTLNLMIKSGHYVNEKRVDVVFKDVIEQQIALLKGDVNEN